MLQGLDFFFARRLRLSCALWCLAVWGAHGHWAAAQNRNWAPIPVDSDWLNAENWIPQGVPTSAETALITHSGTFDVALSESQTVGGLTLGGAQGAQTLTLSGGAILTVDPGGSKVQVQGTGVLILDDASVVGPVENHALIQLRQGTLSSLTVNGGLIEAIDSASSINSRPNLNPKLGTIRVRAESAPASLTYGNPQLPLPLGNAGRIELVSTSGHAASLDLVGPGLTVLDTGVVSLSGGGCVLDVGAVNNAGDFGGHGELTGDLLNEARVHLSAVATGTLQVGGVYTQSPTASLEVEIAGAEAGSQYDVLDVAATADVAGSLIVDFLGGFVPGADDEFAILRRVGGSGEFETVQVSGLPEHGFTIRYELDAVIMDFLSGDEILSGDFNGNQQVEQGDLDLVLLNWGSEGRTPLGWVNDLPDSTIDQNELDRVLLRWGNAPAGLSSSGVPEPSSWAILPLAAATLCFIRPRRRASRR